MDDYYNKEVEHEITIVSVRLYSDYGDDGSIDEAKFIGIRYAAMPSNYEEHFRLESIGGEDLWFMLEGKYADRCFDTPEEALEAEILKKS